MYPNPQFPVRSADFEIFAEQMLRVQITATRKADEDLSYMRLTWNICNVIIKMYITLCQKKLFTSKRPTSGSGKVVTLET